MLKSTRRSRMPKRRRLIMILMLTLMLRKKRHLKLKLIPSLTMMKSMKRKRKLFILRQSLKPKSKHIQSMSPKFKLRKMTQMFTTRNINRSR